MDAPKFTATITDPRFKNDDEAATYYAGQLVNAVARMGCRSYGEGLKSGHGVWVVKVEHVPVVRKKRQSGGDQQPETKGEVE